jgi:hypothetical protein
VSPCCIALFRRRSLKRFNAFVMQFRDNYGITRQMVAA